PHVRAQEDDPFLQEPVVDPVVQTRNGSVTGRHDLTVAHVCSLSSQGGRAVWPRPSSVTLTSGSAGPLPGAPGVRRRQTPGPARETEPPPVHGTGGGSRRAGSGPGGLVLLVDDLTGDGLLCGGLVCGGLAGGGPGIRSAALGG